MTNYNYLEAMIEDVKEYLRNEAEYDQDDLFYNRNDLEERLHDDLWTNDSVTGNASGSYTFSTWKAEEYLCHNYDELADACEAFCQDIGEAVKRGAEFCDVTIRCYLLGRAISEALDEIEEELENE